MQPETILIIEDNDLNLQLATDLLEANGCTVLQARTAEEGLLMARRNPPTAILMDLSLPEIDGLLATSIIKSHPQTCDIIIIALTAHAMKGDETIARRVGCDGYLTKPINTRTFVSDIRDLIYTARNKKEAA